MAAREFEIVLWGATGFTGKLVAEYLTKEYARGLSWALAGRNAQKLEQVKAELGEGAKNIPVIIADSNDLPSLESLAKRTRVVITTVGPYILYGKFLVEACAKNGTHYCDLTGEPSFINWSIKNWDAEAKKTQAMIVHACGYDSIPSDLGTFLVADHMAKKHQRKLAYVTSAVIMKELKGGASGGTIASAKLAIQNPDLESMDPYALVPKGLPRGNDKDYTIPHYDSDVKSYVATFVMAMVNSKVVRRSNALLGMSYGQAFSYHEEMATGSGVSGFVTAVVTTLGLMFMAYALRFFPDAILNRFIPQPGEGPSRRAQERGAFKHVFVGRSEDKKIAVQGIVAGKVDPGYLGTSRMLAEAAVCLAKDDVIGKQGGVLTPASAMGGKLIDRLKAVGFTYEVQDIDA
eukprot:comp18557_c0_seq1/m.20037 comp18557_c0_seq1/g.20037  ORF comp18557_c0_seq1/g.20037 comp18557_c0_seq1/m.20037 type:complete len:404 (-) comp18557_c0_seq1:323-1534(-)